MYYWKNIFFLIQFKHTLSTYLCFFFANIALKLLDILWKNIKNIVPREYMS